MKPTKLEDLVNKYGDVEAYTAGQIFHAQDFPNKLFFLKKGYVKRYQARQPDKKVLELIYGPGHFISLSQLYKLQFGVDQNQENFIYVYQAMTDVEVSSLDADFVVKQLDKDPSLYKDLWYESGIKLRSNIFRLASNSFQEDDKRVAHQLVSLAYEFSGLQAGDNRKIIKLPMPETLSDLAEQLNISEKAVAAAVDELISQNLIEVDGNCITILDVDHLKDVYL